jgi:hypothetical protein
MKEFRKTVTITDVVDGPDGLATAYGIMTAEKVDKDNERCIYDWQVPLTKAWSNEIFESTTLAGQEPSLGNVRLMHAGVIAGKVQKMDFDDAAKAIKIGAQAANAEISDMLRRGLVTGFSQAGRYTKKSTICCSADPQEDEKTGVVSCSKCKKANPVVDYAAKISEVSFVDNPCLDAAHFDSVKSASFRYQKANGSSEMRKFAPAEKSADAAPTKRVAGEDLPESAFAYVGDPKDTSTWKFPIKFSSPALTRSHLRNALARWEQAKGIPEDEKEKVHARITAAARAAGIEVSADKMVAAVTAKFSEAVTRSAAKHNLKKGLHDVSRFAQILQDLAYLWRSSIAEEEYEGDDSEMPDMLRDHVEQLADSLVTMCAEEAAELIPAAKAVIPVATKTAEPNTGAKKMNEEMLKAAKKGLAAHFKKMGAHFGKCADMHEKMAASHGEMKEACKAMMEHHKGEVGKADGETSAGPKAQMAFCKAQMEHHTDKEAHHEKMGKAMDAMAEHAHAMASGMDYDSDAGKAALAQVCKDVDAEMAKSAEPDVAAAVSEALKGMQKGYDAKIDALTALVDKLTAVGTPNNPVLPIGQAVKGTGTDGFPRGVGLQLIKRDGSGTPTSEPDAEDGSVGL